MLKVVCLALFVAAVSAGIPYKDCGHSEVTSLEVSGCPSAPCILHKGKETTFTIKYTANQDTAKAEWSLHAIVGGVDMDLSTLIPGFDKDGCKDTPCPIKKGESKTFTYKVVIPAAAPDVEADVKARLIGEKSDLFCGTVHGSIKA
ncbi:unnamed protein product [Medioppia subpectinata]|uniref:MD-2-related lipid-recognition domain-containing protein n=1 Tax=Medioppia subpectinata TaxID=1979941 RepID=A0A7R9L5R4_9ACAR|nr:unnamed protein product [Medioppia subpectinata]CAG2115870.1 unnamed protein product [Medioppia subpectinata]